MKKWCWVVLACIVVAAPVKAQSQFETTFEAGVGYTRPGIGGFDMVSLLVQSDDYLFEFGLGFNLNAGGFASADVVNALFRAAVRPIIKGNTLVHVGGEFSVHTDAASDGDTLLGLSAMLGVSQPLTDHLNFEVHVFPISLGFGGIDTIVKIPSAQLGAHIMF